MLIELTTYKILLISFLCLPLAILFYDMFYDMLEVKRINKLWKSGKFEEAKKRAEKYKREQ